MAMPPLSAPRVLRSSTGESVRAAEKKRTTSVMPVALRDGRRCRGQAQCANQTRDNEHHRNNFTTWLSGFAPP